MLEELDIRNVAVAEHVRVQFAPGFNAITGETGAGKSIIIDALGLLLGGRADPDLVRAGADTARVEGVFRVPEPADEGLNATLADLGIELDIDQLLIISREVARRGRSAPRINGRAVTGGALVTLGRRLVDIHGQTDNLSILRPAEHLGYLDRFAGLNERRSEFAILAAELRETRTEIQRISDNERERARRQDRLAYEVQEIDDAQLRPQEEEELRAERQLLSSAEDLAKLTDAVLTSLTGGGRGGSAVDRLGAVAENLAQLAHLDPRMNETAIQADALQSQVYDLARDLRAYREGVEHNPRRLEAIEERLGVLGGLKRKYGATLEEVLAYAERARGELEDLFSSDERLAALREREEELRVRAGSVAEQLSRARRAAAVQLAAAVEREIADLRLVGGRFAVQLERRSDPEGIAVSLPAEEMAATAASDAPDTATPMCAAYDRTGVDRIEFYVALNPGEPLRPLIKVASGGETARLLLALKTILGAADDVPTLVFDEVDVGIGARSGAVVGEKLAGLAAHHQVICITHLAQVAARSGAHFVVAKHVDSGRTFTDVRQIAGDERTRELAAMLGDVSEAHLAAAGELLRGTGQLAPDLPAAGRASKGRRTSSR